MSDTSEELPVLRAPVREKHYAEGSRPKPHGVILCSNSHVEKKQISSMRGTIDFYWRYFKCLVCDEHYWVGVSKDGERTTVITRRTPKEEKNTRLTGNLANILPPDHPAVTEVYRNFMSTGILRHDSPMARALGQTVEPSTDPDITSESKPTQEGLTKEEIESKYWDENPPEAPKIPLTMDRLLELQAEFMNTYYLDTKDMKDQAWRDKFKEFVLNHPTVG